jgi:glucosylglycerate hydrolase
MQLSYETEQAKGFPGAPELAANLRTTALDQLARRRGFPEYIEPFTGASLGSADQSWTAAVVLDWLRSP